MMGFNDDVLDVDHADYANTCCIDIPRPETDEVGNDEVFDVDHADYPTSCCPRPRGPETDEVGKLARQWNVYIMAQAKARHKDWKDRFFNIGFILDPDGNIILQ